MVSILNQLNWLSTFSQEIFQGVFVEAGKTAQRMLKIKERIKNLQNKLPEVETMFSDYNPDFFYKHQYREKREFRRRDQPMPMVFTRNGAPFEVNRRRDSGFPLPKLDVMNQYLTEDDKEKGFTSCIQKYSKPSYFEEQWAKMEIENMERIKRERRERRRKRPKPNKSRTHNVPVMTQKRYDPTGLGSARVERGVGPVAVERPEGAVAVVAE